MDWQAGMPSIQSSGNWSQVSAESWMERVSFGDPTRANQGVTKILVRLATGEQTPFTERDVILDDGGIVIAQADRSIAGATRATGGITAINNDFTISAS